MSGRGSQKVLRINSKSKFFFNPRFPDNFAGEFFQSPKELKVFLFVCFLEVLTLFINSIVGPNKQSE